MRPPIRFGPKREISKNAIAIRLMTWTRAAGRNQFGTTALQSYGSILLFALRHAEGTRFQQKIVT